jgi:hypothetical protein
MSEAIVKKWPCRPPATTRPARSSRRKEARQVARSASTQVHPMPRVVCASLPPTRVRPVASARADAVRFCADRRDLDGVDPRHEDGDVRRADEAVDPRSDVIEAGEDPVVAQVWQEHRHVVPASLDLQELLFGDVEDVEMDAHAIVREGGRHLAADDDIRLVGEGQGTGDAVVVGDRHQVHAPGLGQSIDLLGPVVRLAHDQAERIERRPARIPGVHVGVELHTTSSICGRPSRRAAGKAIPPCRRDTRMPAARRGG